MPSVWAACALTVQPLLIRPAGSRNWPHSPCSGGEEAAPRLCSVRMRPSVLQALNGCLFDEGLV